MRSKRQRKQKDRNSLKRKRTDAQHDDSEEEYNKDTNVEMLVRAPKTIHGLEGAETRKLSKGEQRKLKQIAKQKEQKAQRAQVFENLEKSALPEGDFALLKSSSSLGQRETKRQRVARELVIQRSGKALPEDNQLLRRRSDPQLHEQAIIHSRHDISRQDSLRHSRSDSDSSDDMSNLGDAQNFPEEEIKSQEEGIAPANDRPSLTSMREAAKQARAALGLDTAKAPSSGRGAKQSEGSGRRRVVAVDRPPEVDEARSQLPIIGMEQEIVESVLENDAVVLSGETGCGKTTQVPQFLYEAGYGCKAYPDRCGAIGVTQPRRVAAIASAARVAAEMGTKLGDLVGYQVRYDRKSGSSSAVKFMTDGILLREAQSDFLLQKYSCLIIDEAHERSLNTDLLIGMLSRIVPLRREMAAAGKGHPLKLIIMSATLRTEDFVDNRRLFPQAPPLVHVPARQFPVTLHFSKHTELYDYSGAAFAKVSQIHRQLPPGGILVFMTGQREVESLCKRLRTSLRADKPKEETSHAKAHVVKEEGRDDNIGLEDSFGGDAAEAAEDFTLPAKGHLAASAKDDYEVDFLSEEEETALLGGEGFSPEQLAEAEKRFQEQMGVKVQANNEDSAGSPVYVLPLYAALPRSEQDKVFGAVPAGHRLIVVATNVAETSLTIPGIRYVVDSGRSKQKLMEVGSGMSRFEVGWISKASSEQRAGRAGRTGPGHCYRLFSSAVYNDQFEAHTPPEILNTPLEGVVLVMKAMQIEQVQNFPFPTAPEATGLKEAVACLEALGALLPGTGSLTALGKQMAGFPISPRHARLILQVAAKAKWRGGVLPYAISLAAAMSVEAPFVHLDSIQGADAESAARERQSARAAQARLRSRDSDALSALLAFLAFQSSANPSAFCQMHRLHNRNMVEMAALHAQLRRIISQKFEDTDFSLSMKTQLPPLISLTLKKAMTAGWADQIARRVRSTDHIAKASEKGSKKRAVRYQCACLDEDVYLHPQSSLYTAAPEFVVYTQLIRSTKRPYMTGVTEIDAHWLAETRTPLCYLSPPLAAPAPKYLSKKDAVMAWQDVTYGRHSWELPRSRCGHPDPVIRSRFFAEALLGGAVLPSMEGLQSELISLPSTVTKLEAQGLPRVGSLVSALGKKGVDSKASLWQVWKRSPSFLYPEMAAWVKKGQSAKLQALWPNLQSECQ